MQPSRGSKRPGLRGRSPGLRPPHWAGRPSLAAQPEPRWPPTLRRLRGARRLQTRPAPSPRSLPAAARRLRTPSRPSPRCGREKAGKRGECGARRARTATARPLSRSPSRARRMGWPGGVARPGGHRVSEPVRPGTARLSPRAAAPRPPPLLPAARAAFVTVSSPSEPARGRCCARGCKWRPALLCASRRSPGPGTSGAPRPGPHPAAAAAGGSEPAAPPPVSKVCGPVPAAPTPRPPSARAARSFLPRAAAHRRVARAGLGKVPGPTRGRYPLSKPFLCALKQVAPT